MINKCFEKASEYKKTKAGSILVLYSRIKYRAKFNQEEIDFDKKWFFNFLFSSNEYSYLFENWVKENYKKDLKPSVDRIDNSLFYLKSNLQILTAGDNRKKGDAEKIKTWGKPINVLDLKNKNILYRFGSIKECSQVLNINRFYIMKVLYEKTKKIDKYIFTFENPDHKYIFKKSEVSNTNKKYNYKGQ